MRDPHERHARLQAVFEEALSHAPSERDAYLDRACAADSELRSAVARLLAAHDSAESFLERPGWLSLAAPAIEDDFRGTALILSAAGSRAQFAVDLAIPLALSFFADGTHFAAVAQDNAVQLWDMNARVQRTTLTTPLVGGVVTSTPFSTDGTVLAVAAQVPQGGENGERRCDQPQSIDGRRSTKGGIDNSSQRWT
jgi:hypothetical protein